MPEGHTSMSFSKLLLEQAGVLVIPATATASAGKGYIRMSLTVIGDKNGERLQEAVDRIAKDVKAVL